jgi:DnaJ family protein C protein 2
MLQRRFRGEPEPEAEEEPQIDDATRAHAEQKRKKHAAGAQAGGSSSSTMFTEDPYELLGLGHLRWRATEEHIKKAYRKQVLIHHPDKKGGEIAEEDADEMFKSLTRAHDTLSDPRKRRDFDSQEPFDDSIPSELIKIESDEQFFSVYGPVIERNSKWAKVHPVPLLGDNDTPYEKVMDFYDFWMTFKSWRNFSGEDEYDPNDAETREEKRWMERQNERERKRRKREELSRVATLIEGAFKRDPRIKRHKLAEKEAKKRVKQDKMDAIRKVREEQERLEAEERERKEKEAKAKAEEETKERQRKANALRDARAKLRKFCRSATDLRAPIADVDQLCSTLPVERLKALIEAIKNGQNAQAAFDAEMSALRKENGVEEKKEEAEQTKTAAAAEEKKAKAASPWTDDELGLLAQGIARYPGGTPNRWRLIADLVNQKADRGTNKTKGRSVQEIITKVGEIKGVGEKSGVQGMVVEDHKKSGKLQKLNAGGPIGGISLRTQVADLVPVVEEPASNGHASSAAPKPKAQPKAQQGEKAAAAATTTTTTAAPESASEKAAAATASPADWSQDQQKKLEAALKKFPASLGVQRWESIAAAVPGMTKKDCVERYKYIVAQLRGKTGAK